jgi:exosome complex component RRP46
VRYTFTCTIIACLSKTTTQEQPTIREAIAAKSIHVLCFSSSGELLLVESEGMFNMEEWEVIVEGARVACLGDVDAMAEDEDRVDTLQHAMKTVVAEKVSRAERWKIG